MGADFLGTVGIPVILALTAWVAFDDLGPWAVAVLIAVIVGYMTSYGVLRDRAAIAAIAAEALHEIAIEFPQVDPPPATTIPDRNE